MSEQLTKQQKIAVTNRGGNLLVSAAAGSGKTKVLVDRLLGYILDDVNPSNIDDFLIITYTNAAAAELRTKIAAKLSEHIAEHPENKHLQQQIQRLYLTKISTVHGFCGDILREFSYALDIPSDFRICDENECREMQSQILTSVLEEAYARLAEDSNLRFFMESQGIHRDDRQIPELILNVYRNSQCHLDPAGWLTWCEGNNRNNQYCDPCETPWGIYLVKDLKASVALHQKALRACIDRAKDNFELQKPVLLLSDTVQKLQTLLDSATWDDIRVNGTIDFGRLTFSKKCSELQLIEEIKSVRKACKDTVNKKLKAFADPGKQVLSDLMGTLDMNKGLVDLVRRFHSEYTLLKNKRRVLDFNDLEHKTLDLLLGKKRTGATSYAREIGARFREIMVDEYQDSNGVQDAIFSVLTKDRNNCFMVGDVKQSIYQFRLADPQIFLDKYNAYPTAENAKPGQGRKVLLNSNFRSSDGVISAVNYVFSTCMSEQVGGLVYGDDERLNEGIPHVPLNEPEVELYGICVQEDTYAEEAEFVSQRILQLLDGSHMIRQGDTLRPIEPKDIVILLRSAASVGGHFRYALEKHGIRCETDSTYNLFLTEEIEVFCSLLQAIHNPLLDIPLIATMCSRVFGFTAEDLASIRSQNRTDSVYAALEQSNNPKAQAFYTALTALREKSRMLNLGELMDYVLSVTRMDSIYAALPNGEECVTNIQSFLQLALQYEGTGRRDLGQFLEHLQALSENGYSAHGEKSSDQCVTIMTIHKSKGLEFPVVFLCGLSRDFNTEGLRAQVLCDKTLGLGLSCLDQVNRVRYPGLMKRAIAAKMQTEGLSEELRVLYVAMTRARDRLIMTYAANRLDMDIRNIATRMRVSDPVLLASEAKCPGDWILQAALKRTEAGAFFGLVDCAPPAEVLPPLWKISVVDVQISSETTDVSFDDDREVPENILSELSQMLSFSYPYQQATQAPSKLVATQMKGRDKDNEVAQNVETIRPYYAARRPSFAQGMPSGTEFGTAMHAAMQYINFSRCDTEDGVRSEIQRLVQDGFLSERDAELVNCRQICRLFSTPLGQKLLKGYILREYKFSLLIDGSEYQESLIDEKILLQGVVDCAIIEDDGIIIIDFKSDNITPQQLKDTVDRYRMQVNTYKNALSRIFEMPVKEAFLYFFRLEQAVSV